MLKPLWAIDKWTYHCPMDGGGGYFYRTRFYCIFMHESTLLGLFLIDKKNVIFIIDISESTFHHSSVV